MAKIIDINEQIAKKFVPRMTADIIGSCALVIATLFIPIGVDCIVVKLINAIRDSGEITMDAIKCGLLIILGCISCIFGVKAICKKNKSYIGSTPGELPDSPFGKFSAEYGTIGFMECFLIIFTMVFFCVEFMEAEANANAIIVISIVCVLKNILFRNVLKISSVQKTVSSLRIANDEQKIQDSLKASDEGAKTDSGSEKRADIQSNENEPSTSASMKERTANLEALLKYKKLYDDGAITEDEYNAKKEELLK